MVCPKCKNKGLKIINARDYEDDNKYRRRECKKCKHRFTTHEIIDYQEAEKEKILEMLKEIHIFFKESGEKIYDMIKEK